MEQPTFEEVRAQKLAAALKMMSPSERHRFEHFCRSRFSLSAIKQLLADLHGVKSTPTMAVVVAGLAKLYVGEIVETARSAMEAHGEVGAIQPRHARGAPHRA